MQISTVFSSEVSSARSLGINSRWPTRLNPRCRFLFSTSSSTARWRWSASTRSENPPQRRTEKNLDHLERHEQKNVVPTILATRAPSTRAEDEFQDDETRHALDALICLPKPGFPSNHPKANISNVLIYRGVECTYNYRHRKVQPEEE